MRQNQPDPEVRAPGVLAGARAWLITDGKAGTDVQAKGVADALGLACETKRVAPGGIWRLLAPWGPVPPADRPGVPGGLLAPPWPDVAIAAGRTSIPYIRALHRAAGPATFTVLLQDPRTSARTADLIWVPEHDRRRGPAVIATTTAPHSYSPGRLAALRRELPPEIAALPHPRIAVVLGGKNRIYAFTPADDARLEAALASLGRLGASFMVTPSRRTHDRLRQVAERATREHPRVLWDGNGPNPYPHFLAAADWLVVTADSVNMTGEACATGRPVYVFEPSGGSAKFRRFHEALRSAGATRPLPDSVSRLEEWSYAPIDSAAVIAAEVERRYLARRATIAGSGGPAST